MTLTVVWAREPIPADPSIFLAGPMPRASIPVPSWHSAAISLLGELRTRPLTVLTPESRDGIRAEHYDDQFAWENAAREAATAILFWIPRDLATLPGFTTNVEFGHDVRTGKVVLGCPPDCPNPERNRYLIRLAEHYAVPVRQTLADTVVAALAIVEARRPTA
ncbi:hypothetical protein GCM10009555_074480 [Acrocarpospora macrocephala]|uniref:Nucleoside 2-deoxyribosyltransferase n=1 Tax=Acrocarpospora macrocephala TaxID=150177 RepID=A0A5M3WXY0_9ACTN|nr:nucleoside 2-deoxyribosyltransferase domain-containing protein [Acrocarpospora macrocephala]GES11393.1 hypothetical protein Amac_049900 [Acrocarpospora macrocephala]